MRVFSAALATETNTFAPMPTGLSSFHERAYYPAGQHPDRMQMHSGPLWAARLVGPARGWTLIEGLVAAAVPNGIVTRAAFEGLRDALLADLRALARRGVTSLDGWAPEPEWEEWIDVWYPSGADTIERVAAHNLTCEYGACQAFLEIKPRLPLDVQKTFDRIIPDEQFHMRLGRQVIERHCTTDDAAERVRARVLHTFELEQAGRLAYNRRMARLGVADLTDPTPPLA